MLRYNHIKCDGLYQCWWNMVLWFRPRRSTARRRVDSRSYPLTPSTARISLTGESEYMYGWSWAKTHTHTQTNTQTHIQLLTCTFQCGSLLFLSSGVNQRHCFGSHFSGLIKDTHEQAHSPTFASYFHFENDISQLLHPSNPSGRWSDDVLSTTFTADEFVEFAQRTTEDERHRLHQSAPGPVNYGWGLADNRTRGHQRTIHAVSICKLSRAQRR